MNRLVLILSLICLKGLFLTGCRQDLRQGAQIWLGIELDRSCIVSDWEDEVADLQHSPITGLMLEVSLDPSLPGPAAGFQYFQPHPLDTLVNRLKDSGVPYGIHLAWTKEESPVPLSRLDAWFSDLAGLLLRTDEFPPEWLLFSGPWTSPTWKNGAVDSFIVMIREGWTAFDGSIWKSQSDPARLWQDSSSVQSVLQVEGLAGPEEIYGEQPDTIGVFRPYTRVLHSSPEWTGYHWRIQNWLGVDPDSTDIRDLFLSGAECGFPLMEDDHSKIRELFR